MSRDAILIAILSTILLVGLAVSSPPLVFLALSVGTAAILGRVWARLGARHLTHEHRLKNVRCQIGDGTEVEIRMDNPTPLPLPWVEVTEALPDEGLELTGGPFGVELFGLSMRTGLGWFERLRRTYHFTARRRGYYKLGPASLRVWDPLGLSFVDRRFEQRVSVTVFPRVLSLRELGISADHPFGDPQRDRWLFRDPLSITGARSYEPGDPLSSIHWPATAVAGEMMTKVQEGTRTPEISIFMNVTTMPVSWHGLVPELLELTLSTTASVAEHALDDGFAVGLYSNGNLVKESPEDSARPITLAPSASPQQLGEILEILARTSDHGRETLEKTLLRHLDPDDYGVHTVVVTPLLTEGLRESLSGLLGRNVPLTVIYTGDRPVPYMPPETDLYSVGGRERWETIAPQ